MSNVKMIALAAFFAAMTAMLGAGCGSDATGPSETPDGWQEYTVDGFTIQWLVEDSLSSIRIKMSAPTTGWVAVGFDPTAMMTDANLLIGYVDGGTTYARDDFGTGQTTHSADLDLGGVDNVQILSGSEASGTTEIELRIPLDSGDAYDKALVQGNTYSVIFARGAEGADDFTSHHAWAEAVSLEI